jgi:hypothetical protein
MAIPVQRRRGIIIIPSGAEQPLLGKGVIKDLRKNLNPEKL